MVFDIYKILVTDCNNDKVNWATNIRNLLFQLGYHYVWYEQDNLNINFDVFNTRLLDQFYQSWHSTIENSDKL